MSYKQYGNQMVVTVKKTPVSEERKFLQSDMPTFQKAMQTLDAGAMMLWLYFAKNKDDYESALSSKDASENWGIGISQYKTAKRKLIDAGFLVCVDESKNKYIFFDDRDLAQNELSKDLAQNEPSTYNENDQVLSTKYTKDLVQNIPTNNIYKINNINNIDDSIEEEDLVQNVPSPIETEYSDAVAAALKMYGLL